MTPPESAAHRRPGVVRPAGGCMRPVLLRGRVDHIDGSTGELIHRYTTVHESNRQLPPITDSILVVRPDIQ
jgi:hypothetical protein